MNIKTISLAATGFGAALFLFAVIMWVGNKPDFYKLGTSTCGLFGSPGGRQYDQCYEEAVRNGDAASSAYNGCLFSSRYALCQGVTAVPYLSIAGIMILLGGGGLFLYGRTRRPA
ncbi:hypothetical protein J2Y55_002127 [Bosea sp. BE125]|uniref:hypothetical protein n=1 Tax=Bosea sp. BE125 TaxID=2817909 RepID=UPI002855C5E9|nr:hypothetical protein [Bosea sp. BE125]MDR6871119.1 hypothetical protein [Bosea sp. BE125]